MPIIKCYKLQQQPVPHSFYIFNKGLNSGKPLAEPCPNCFVCACSSQEEKEFYYWLCFGLWQAKYWQVFLSGSIIEFLRIADFKSELQARAAQLQNHAPAWKAVCKKAAAINELQANYKSQVIQLQQLKVAYIRQMLKP